MQMAKRPTKQQSTMHSWTVYHLAAKQKYVGTVNAPDEKTAIARVIAEYKVPPNERGRLMALRRS